MFFSSFSFLSSSQAYMTYSSRRKRFLTEALCFLKSPFFFFGHSPANLTKKMLYRFYLFFSMCNEKDARTSQLFSFSIVFFFPLLVLLFSFFFFNRAFTYFHFLSFFSDDYLLANWGIFPLTFFFFASLMRRHNSQAGAWSLNHHFALRFFIFILECCKRHTQKKKIAGAVVSRPRVAVTDAYTHKDGRNTQTNEVLCTCQFYRSDTSFLFLHLCRRTSLAL